MKYIIHTAKLDFETYKTIRESHEVTAEELKALAEYRDEDTHGVTYNTVELTNMTETEMHFFLERRRYDY